MNNISAFRSILGMYVQSWANLCEYTAQGKSEEALLSAKQALRFAYELDQAASQLEDANISFPFTPYDTFYGETVKELKGDGMLVDRQWVPWPFDRDKLDLPAR